MKRSLALGLLAALAWTMAARVSFDQGLQPVRPLYDGNHALAPYRWVKAPRGAEATNQPPTTTVRTFDLVAGKKSPAESIAAGDAQASIIFAEGAMQTPPGATSVELTITPSIPVPLVKATGVTADGNTYRFDAVYLPSREPARFIQPCPEVTLCATIILRYPLYGKRMFRHDGQAWAEVQGTQSVPGGDQVYGNVTGLGGFVAAGVPADQPRDDSFVNLLALGLGIATVAGAVIVGRLAPARRKARARKRKAAARNKDRNVKKRAHTT